MRLALCVHCLLLPVLLLAACSSSGPAGNYKITLKDGREYLSSSRPQYQGKTGYYRYRTFQKRDALLRADEVLMIEEQGA
jgi:hypothetical protein